MQAMLRFVFISIFSLKWILGQQMEKNVCCPSERLKVLFLLWPSLMARRGWKKIIASVLRGARIRFVSSDLPQGNVSSPLVETKSVNWSVRMNPYDHLRSCTVHLHLESHSLMLVFLWLFGSLLWVCFSWCGLLYHTCTQYLIHHHLQLCHTRKNIDKKILCQLLPPSKEINFIQLVRFILSQSRVILLLQFLYMGLQ